MSVFTPPATEAIPPAPVTRMSYVLDHLILANNGLSSKADVIAINNRYYRPDTPNCVGYTPIVHLCLKDFREVGSLTKKAVKPLISHGFTALYDGGIDGYSITAGFNFSIFCFFNSIDECTYLFNVIFTLECPRISLKLLISNPSSTHLVAKVCRNA